MNVKSRVLASTALTGALALALTACGSDAVKQDETPAANSNTTPAATDTATDAPAASGSLAGAGSSAQEAAMGGWIATLSSTAPGLTVSYDPVGSGGGREQFLAGGVQFAGSDAALSADELAAAKDRCFGGEAIELPVYISPIAVVYNLPSVKAEHINMSGETMAKVFNGTIKKWNDPAIAAENEGVELPDIAIIPVNRSDKSGTTENFTDYLAQASNGAWTDPAGQEWPIAGTQSGAQTQGMIDTVSGAEGAIGYADASRAGDLGTVAVKVGDSYVPFSAEAAAKVVDSSPRAEGATDKQIAVALDRKTTEAGAYPIVLVSYDIACSVYDTAEDATNVKAFLSYVASAEGQNVAAAADVAGSAPISDALRAEVQAAIDSISAK